MSVIYLICMNLVGFFCMALDKNYAVKHKRRIPERHLLAVALCGGSAGVFCGMKFFRHKTRHLKFSAGIPVIILLQLILGAWVFIIYGNSSWVKSVVL